METKESTLSSLGAIDQWQRLFRVQGLRYLIDDIWMEHYRTLSALTIIINDEYTSYLPREVIEKTLFDGADLVSSKDLFQEYETTFRQYMEETNNYIASLHFDSISQAETELLLQKIAKIFFYYSKTEFFYTDGAYTLFEKTKDTGLESRLTAMGAVKNDGRSFFNGLFFGSDRVLPRLLAAFEKRFGVPERTLQQYSRAELLALFDNTKVADSEIENRNDAFYIAGKDTVLFIKTGKEAREEIISFTGEKNHIQTEIVKGITAHKGVAKGTARIIRSGYDNFDTLHKLMDAMQKGDILIAETTSPELMPACQKAGGIITDQGGMLSHAAIVSRELNIPCIVGTTNATEVIQEGDIIEMDGASGIIKVIERISQA